MTTPEPPPLLVGEGISKTFGGETALAGVDFDLRAGEVHGVVGSNGAGKSTLMKILAGVLPDHGGTVRIDGRAVELNSPREAARLGIAMIHQELSGVGSLSVAENVMLGRQPVRGLPLLKRIDWRAMRKDARGALDELNIDVDLRSRLDNYPLAVAQMVEIARGVHSGARILILDEPTSALSPPEVERLFALIRDLKGRGVAMVFISHFIEDVLEICDRVTILRDGEKVETVATAETDRQTVIRRMLGTEGTSANDAGTGETVTARKLPPKPREMRVLFVERLSKAGVFDGIELAVAPGETLGLYGFVGAGHQELLASIAGAEPRDRGTVHLKGTALPNGRVDRAVAAGVVMVGSDRVASLLLNEPIHKNVTMAHLRNGVGAVYTDGRSVRAATPLIERVGCRPDDPRLTVGSLSGGNQQKIVFAKWLLGDIQVLLLDEPTRGMDVAAKAEVLRLVDELKAGGAAVILASTEPELILSQSDRVMVFHRGRCLREFANEPLDKETLTRYASGIRD